MFIVATANDVTKLRHVFLREGHSNQKFFVDLPNKETRKSISEIHLRKRGKNPGNFDLAKLVSATEGFSGSEIEQVVVAGLYTAFSAKTELTTKLLSEEIAATGTLFKTMAEKVTSLRQWAAERTVSAH